MAESNVCMIEQHFSPKQLAELWGFSENTIRKIFQDREGVIKLGSALSKRSKRPYVSLRIPASVAERVHREISK